MSEEYFATELIHDEQANLVFVEAPSPRHAFEALRDLATKKGNQFICLSISPGADGKTNAIGTLGPVRAVIQDPFDGELARVISNSLACTPF